MTMGELFLTDFGPIDESAGGGGASTAVAVSYDGAPGLTAVDVEAALDELAARAFEPIVTIPSTTTVLAEDHDFVSDWPTTDKILISGYGYTVDFVATAANAETPRIVADQDIYIEYYAPPVAVSGPGEVWEFVIQFGVAYSGGATGDMAFFALPLSLDADNEVLAYQYQPFVNATGQNGYFSPPGGAGPYNGPHAITMISGDSDTALIAGIGVLQDNGDPGVITFYGGTICARRLA